MKHKTARAGISAKIICDSVSPQGVRMTTMEIEYPRFILAELNTHRMLSKNSASSRAIPVKTMHQHLVAEPVHWGQNRSGMQADQELEASDKSYAKYLWSQAREYAKKIALELGTIGETGVHKQVTNRVTEPWMMMKTVISGTEWANFYWLRDHQDAQPEIRELAGVMHEVHLANTPRELAPGEWHLPYVDTQRDKCGNLFYRGHAGEELELKDALVVSASCCAQVSYRKTDDTLDKAYKIYDQLIKSEPCHASPVEHQATPLDLDTTCAYEPETWEQGVTHVCANGSLWSGNLQGWIQHRKLIQGEAVWGQIN